MGKIVNYIFVLLIFYWCEKLRFIFNIRVFLVSFIVNISNRSFCKLIEYIEVLFK